MILLPVAVAEDAAWMDPAGQSMHILMLSLVRLSTRRHCKWRTCSIHLSELFVPGMCLFPSKRVCEFPATSTTSVGWVPCLSSSPCPRLFFIPSHPRLPALLLRYTHVSPPSLLLVLRRFMAMGPSAQRGPTFKLPFGNPTVLGFKESNPLLKVRPSRHAPCFKIDVGQLHAHVRRKCWMRTEPREVNLRLVEGTMNAIQE